MPPVDHQDESDLRDRARAIITEMHGKKTVPDRSAARHYKRLATISYMQALRLAPSRSPNLTTAAIGEAYFIAEKAIHAGLDVEIMNESLYRIRRYVVPLLADAASPCVDCGQIASGDVRLQDTTSAP